MAARVRRMNDEDPELSPEEIDRCARAIGTPNGLIGLPDELLGRFIAWLDIQCRRVAKRQLGKQRARHQADDLRSEFILQARPVTGETPVKAGYIVNSLRNLLLDMLRKDRKISRPRPSGQTLDDNRNGSDAAQEKFGPTQSAVDPELFDRRSGPPIRGAAERAEVSEEVSRFYDRVDARIVKSRRAAGSLCGFLVAAESIEYCRHSEHFVCELSDELLRRLTYTSQPTVSDVFAATAGLARGWDRAQLCAAFNLASGADICESGGTAMTWISRIVAKIKAQRTEDRKNG